MSNADILLVWKTALGANKTITYANFVAGIVAGGSNPPGGLAQQLQYNNAGVFGGIPGATFDGTTLTLTSPTITTPTGLVKNDVGLGNVDNTTDANKPISLATQAALDLKAPIASPGFTGTPSAPTAAPGTVTTQLATTAFVAAAITAAAGVSSVAVTTANGFSGSVINPTTTAAITVSISGALTFPSNIRQTFVPGATNSGLNVGSFAGDPSSLSNGDIWYSSSANAVRIRANGTTFSVSASGGGVLITDSPTWTGIHTWTPTARTSGAAAYFTVNSPADTTLTTGVETPGVVYGTATRQHAGSTGYTSQRDYLFSAITHSFASATGTITNGATVTITDAPIVGTNAAITNRFALWLQAGSLGFGASGSIATISSVSGAIILSAAGTNQNIALNPIGTGTVTTKVSSMTNSILLGVSGTSNTYGILSFNGVATATGMLGIQAGGGSDLNIAYQTPTTGTHRFHINNALVARVISTGFEVTGSMLGISATSGLGYGTGAGGAVTQATSRSTGVTLNTVSGDITLFSAAGSATPTTITVTNSAVAATDTISISQKSGTDIYYLLVSQVAAGSFKLTFFTTGGTTTEQPVFHYNVIKGVNA